jgi:hypothetical protein
MVQQRGVEVPTTYEEAVRILAEAHAAVHGPGTEIYRCDDPHSPAESDPPPRVCLLEVHRRFPSARSDQLRATQFGRARDFPFKSAVVLASSTDVDRLRDGTLRLPEGWHFDGDRRVWPS